MEKLYSIDELSTLWDFYKESKSFSVFKDGKWEHTIMKEGETIKPDGVRCKLQDTENTMGFIEYLEQINGAN